MVPLHAFASAWSVSRAFFGIHLALAGYLTLKSGYLPRALGRALLIGEVALFLWLFIRNAKMPDTQ